MPIYRLNAASPIRLHPKIYLFIIGNATSKCNSYDTQEETPWIRVSFENKVTLVASEEVIETPSTVLQCSAPNSKLEHNVQCQEFGSQLWLVHGACGC